MSLRIPLFIDVVPAENSHDRYNVVLLGLGIHGGTPTITNITLDDFCQRLKDIQWSQRAIQDIRERVASEGELLNAEIEVTSAQLASLGFDMAAAGLV